LIRAGAATPARDSHMRRVELSHHEIQQPPHLVGCLSTRNPCSVDCSNRVPVHAVELVVVETVPHVSPSLAEHFHLFLTEIDIHLGADSDLPRLTGLDRHEVDASLLEIKHFSAVGRKLRVRLRAGG
jgi:hypothetical protein